MYIHKFVQVSRRARGKCWLKYGVLGTRRRGMPALGAFNHTTGEGHVAAHRGDYYDAIENCKAAVHLVNT